MRKNTRVQPWTIHDSLGVALFVLTLALLAWGHWGAVPGLLHHTPMEGMTR